MSSLAWLVPIALALGGLSLAAFLWALRSGQFDDLEGAAYRILEDDREEPTSPPTKLVKDERETAEGAGAEKDKG